MKIGINTYSFLWTETLESSVRTLAEYGIKSIEFLVSPPHFYLSDYKPGMYSRINKIMEANRMETLTMNIPGLDINMASPYPEMRKMTVDLYKKTIDIGLELNCKMLLVAPGKRHPLLPPDFDYVYQLARDSVLRVLDYASKTNIILGIETLPSLFLEKTSDLKKFVDDIGSDQVKICFDAANVFMQEDPAQAIYEVKDKLCLVHVSDTRKTRWEHNVIGTGEVDFTAFGNALKNIGYNGDVVLEVINDKGIAGIQESILQLKKKGWSL
ncbi:MAG: hypothetical protein JM58_17610 [Peptococcaceae bacterium BICA1-8]|nr:MAG: hypothetical protein JM58_17610 [Peptococcaceae bacterium BICA1-8]